MSDLKRLWTDGRDAAMDVAKKALSYWEANESYGREPSGMCALATVCDLAIIVHDLSERLDKLQGLQTSQPTADAQSADDPNTSAVPSYDPPQAPYGAMAEVIRLHAKLKEAEATAGYQRQRVASLVADSQRHMKELAEAREDRFLFERTYALLLEANATVSGENAAYQEQIVALKEESNRYAASGKVLVTERQKLAVALSEVVAATTGFSWNVDAELLQVIRRIRAIAKDALA